MDFAGVVLAVSSGFSNLFCLDNTTIWATSLAQIWPCIGYLRDFKLNQWNEVLSDLFLPSIHFHRKLGNTSFWRRPKFPAHSNAWITFWLSECEHKYQVNPEQNLCIFPVVFYFFCFSFFYWNLYNEDNYKNNIYIILWARHCYKYFPYIISFFLTITILTPIYSWGNWGTERLNHWPKVTQLISQDLKLANTLFFLIIYFFQLELTFNMVLY